MSALRNIGILAHIDAGKTTLTEQLLSLTGVVRRAGSVDEGTATTDWLVQEQQRGITIGSAAIACRYRDVDITIVDTPGHVDFTIEVERSLRVLDGAVVVLSGPDGVQAQTETVWHQASRRSLPMVGFVNKLDREGFDDERLQAEIRDRLGIEPLPLQVPLEHGDGRLRIVDVLSERELVWEETGRKSGARAGLEGRPDEEGELHRQLALERIVDMATRFDDELAEQILLGATPSTAAFLPGLRRAVEAGECLPLVYGVARTGAGLARLADAIVDLLPGPEAAGAQRMFELETGALGRVSFAPDDERSVAFVFKTEPRRGGQRLAYARVFSGRLERDMRLLRLPGRESYRIGRIVRVMGGSEEPVDWLEAGEIGGLLHRSDEPLPRTGETLAGSDYGWSFERIDAPRPVIAVAIEGEDSEDDAKMRAVLQLATHDDPSLSLQSDRGTGQTLLAGMGELHLELAFERLREEHGVRFRTGPPRARLRRIVRTAAEGVGTDIGEMTGARVEVGIGLSPIARGLGEVVRYQGQPPRRREWREALEAGLIEGLGVGGSDQIVGVEITVTDLVVAGAEPAPVAFRNAALRAVSVAVDGAGAVAAEPWMVLNVVVPDEHVGRVAGDLARRRARIRGSESRGAQQVIAAEAPLAELIGYATALRSLTAGRGVFTMEPAGYEPA